MKKKMTAPIKYIATSTLFLIAGAIFSPSYASNNSNTAGQAVAVLQDIDKNIPANAFAITKMLNNAFNPFDALFPTVNTQNPDQLNTLASVNLLTSQWTQNIINAQLQTIPQTIANAYAHLSGGNSNNNSEASSQDLINTLTAGKPSFDTFYLPPNIICKSSDGGCAQQQSRDQLQQNANSINFDAFFTPANYASIPQGSNTAQNYISYALQTYQPLVTNNTVNTGAPAQNKPFFQLLNEQLQNDPKNANSFLMQKIINNPDFQNYWITLRSTEAKNSILLSNFNFLAAERTPQKGLGSAYGLTDSKGSPIADASAMQVEQTLINKTVYNPVWYQQMKTAPLATLQREQLLLTSLLVRLQYHNEMINERNLATQLIIAQSIMQQNKMGLQQQEEQLKAEIFPNANQPSQAQQQLPNTDNSNNSK